MFSKVETDLMKRLINKLTERHLIDGETLFLEGSVGESAFIIKEGAISISKECPAGEVELAMRSTGELIGELALIDEAPRMARAKAKQNTTVWSIPKQEFNHLIAESPCAARGIIDIILPRMRETEAILSRSRCELLKKSSELEEALEALQGALEEAKKARELAEAASLAKSRFLANMSHELRTPLNSIIGFAELIAEEVEYLENGPEELIEDALSIQQASQYLHGLLGNVLDLARIEAGRLKLDIHEVSIFSLATSVVNTITPLIQKQHNQFDFQCDPNLGEIYTDTTKVQQILINLIGNANKFTKEGTISLHINQVPHPPLTSPNTIPQHGTNLP
jgi:signal transduction histidine kinase